MESIWSWLYIRKWRVYKNLGRFGLLPVDDLPSEISVTDVNVCFNINYLSLENGVTDIIVEDFPYLQAIHLSTSEKRNGFSMWLQLQLYYIMMMMTYLTPIVESNMVKWL